MSTRKHGKQFCDRRVVAESFADVRVSIGIAGAKNKACAELKGIFAQLVLVMPGGVGALARDGIVAAKQVQQRSLAKPCRPVSFHLRIDEQRKRDSRLLAKNARIAEIAQADGRQIRSSCPEFRFVLAQLRDVLAAEHSTIVAQKDDRSGP